MRIVAGAFRGRTLIAPPGQNTRPTADRVRQALFDMLMHAPWAGPTTMLGAVVLDAFAGTGALGLEALSRGADTAWFFENDPAAVKTLRTNIDACNAAEKAVVVPRDVLLVTSGKPVSLAFLDPPYEQDLVPRAISRLRGAGWITSDTLIIAETGRQETWTPTEPILAERAHGPARLLAFRAV
jgi:16S rRNA (guanine966-N2)-methyltransferase